MTMRVLDSVYGDIKIVETKRRCGDLVGIKIRIRKGLWVKFEWSNYAKFKRGLRELGMHIIECENTQQLKELVKKWDENKKMAGWRRRKR